MVECPKCGHDNDLGRVFCVKCGDKLEISKVVAPSRFRRGRDAQANVFKEIAVKVLKVAILAAVAAFLSLAALPPDFETKDFSAVHLRNYQIKHSQLERAVKGQQPIKLTFEEGDLNAAMAEAIKEALKNVEEDSFQVRLERVYFSLQEGRVLVTIQQKWRWLQLTAQLRAKPDQKDGKWHFRTDQISIGSFPLPSWLPAGARDTLAGAFKNIWQNLDTERQWLEDLQMMEIKPGRLILSTKTRGA